MVKRDYSRGKIYKLENLETGKIYIGSTTKKYLSERLTAHKSDYNRWKDGKCGYITSFDIFEGGEYQITLLESYPCQTLDELHSRERHYIQMLDCVNKVVPTRTKREYYEDNHEELKAQMKEYRETHREAIVKHKKEYYEANRDAIADYKKQYYEANREVISEKRRQFYEANHEAIRQQNKEYRETHREAILKQKRDYYDTNRDGILDKMRQTIECPCGCQVSFRNKSRHEKSRSHKKWVEYTKGQTEDD